jgi:hypothetical protein
LVLPAPGSSIEIGVSSAWTMREPRTNARWASYSGINCAPVCPLQLASVERAVCTPERALICSCR